MTTPITPDERAAARKSSEEGYSLWADTALRLLDAIDAAEYERDEESVAARLNLSRAERAEAEVVLLRNRVRRARQQRDEAEAECDEAQGRAKDEVWRAENFLQMERAAAAAAVRDVLALHQPEWSCGNPAHTNPDVGCPECAEQCTDCGQTWPCATLRAITPHIGTDPKETP